MSSLPTHPKEKIAFVSNSSETYMENTACCFGPFLTRHVYLLIPRNLVTIAAYSGYGTVLILPTVVESFGIFSEPPSFRQSLIMMILWSKL